MKNAEGLYGWMQKKHIEMLRLELIDVMDNFKESSMKRIEVLVSELERLEPMSHEFDVESSKREFFRKYYKHN